MFFLVCPDSIATSGRYFNERERAQLQARLQTNGAADTRFHRDQLVEALLDPSIWLMLTMAAAICTSIASVATLMGADVVNGSVTAFGARIISSVLSLRRPLSRQDIRLHESRGPRAADPRRRGDLRLDLPGGLDCRTLQEHHDLRPRGVVHPADHRVRTLAIAYG